MSRVVHFEVYADDMARAREFYTKVFGWEFTKYDGGSFEYWMIVTGKDTDLGINGGMLKRMEHSEGEKPIMGSYVNTIGVGSLDESIKKVTDAGGKVVVKKNAIPKMGWLCYCNDTEGNIFGMMQPDESAT